MATSNNFVGTNSRTLAAFLNASNSDIEFVSNPKNGKIFATLTSTGEAVSISENAQSDIKANGIGSIADYQVVDMPGKDATTGMPNGTIFTLITKRSASNVIGTLCR